MVAAGTEGCGTCCGKTERNNAFFGESGAGQWKPQGIQEYRLRWKCGLELRGDQAGAVITESVTGAWKVKTTSQNGQRHGQLRTELQEHRSLRGVRREKKHCPIRKGD